MSRTHPVLRRRRAERAGLLDTARSWVRELRGDMSIQEAVVFGSVARGDFNRWSDIDLLLVSDDFEGPLLRRVERLGDRPPRVQPVCWTTEEWRAQVDRGNPIAIEAKEVGVRLT